MTHARYTLFPYQLEGAAWLADPAIPDKLLCDEQGVGKTGQVVKAMDLLGVKNPLVICTATLLSNWKREIRTQQDVSRPVHVVRTGRDAVPPTGAVIVSYNLCLNGRIFELLRDRETDLLVLDEAHALKNPKSKRTKQILGNGARRKGGIIEDIPRTFALTGTPVPNNASEIWTLLRALAPDAILYKDKPMGLWQFENRYCKIAETPFGRKITGSRNLKSLKRVLKPFMLRRKKKDVAPQLPPLTFGEIVLSLTQINVLNTVQLGVEPETIERVVDSIRSKGKPGADAIPLAEARRATGLMKVDPIVSLLKEEFEGGLDKIVVFAHHIQVLDQLFTGLQDFNPVLIKGATPGKHRQEYIDRFQTDPNTRVFLGQLMATREGITLTSSHNVLFAETDWVPSTVAQAAARCHRHGTVNPVLARFATLRGSIDERINSVVAKKAADISQLLD